jgi:hypothetical protein
VDYVINSIGKYKLPIALILIVAKKDDFEQARAQCYMDLYFAAQMNIKHSVKSDFPLYGIISNSLFWIFVRYDPKLYDEDLEEQKEELFTESDAISIGKDQELINGNASISCWYLEEACLKIRK